MSENAQTPTQPATQFDAEADLTSRANALVAKLRAGEDVPDVDEPAPPAKKVDEKPAAEEPEAATEPEEPAKEEAKTEPVSEEDERKTRLKKALELERAAKGREAKIAQREAAAEEREKKIAERESAAEQRAKDAEKRLAELEKIYNEPALWMDEMFKRVPPQTAIEYLRKAQDPGYQAELTVRRELAKQVKPELDPEVATLKEKLKEFEQKEQARAAEAARANAERDALGYATEHAETYPDAARLMKTDRDEFIKRLHGAADALRERGEHVNSYDAVLQEMSEQIAKERERAAKLYGLSPSAGEASTSQKSNQAASGSKARTLSTRNSAGRSTVNDDDEFASLSLEERSARLKELARRTG